jgi:hypothetical protein
MIVVPESTGRFRGTIRGIKINDLGEMRIRFRFVLIQKLTRKELWTIWSIACGWSLRAVARIPQITSLRPGKP